MKLNSQIVDMAVAERRDQFNNGDVTFQQVIKGWSGAGFDSRSTSIGATYWEAGKFSNVSIEVVRSYRGRTYVESSSIVIDEASALEFALMVGPGSLTDEHESHAALIKALKFYADPKRYAGSNQRLHGDDPYTPADEAYLKDVTRDHGAIAVAALAAAGVK